MTFGEAEAQEREPKAKAKVKWGPRLKANADKLGAEVV